MSSNRTVNPRLISAVLAIAAGAPVASHATTHKPATCQRIQLTGEVQSGQQWSSPIGQGWIFRLVPVQPGKEGYSGWDLVVDPEEGSGYPDALLLATPPYYSISEREVATTFGLRAQDAIGWNPRSFHFLTDKTALRDSQKLYRNLSSQKIWTEKPTPDNRQQDTMRALQKINQNSSPGLFRILNARLTPGIADVAPFAQRWALQSSRTPHTNVPSPTARPTPLGELHWVRFSITLWLPVSWQTPKAIRPSPAPCSR